MVDKIQVPVYLEQGFWDNNVKANPIPDFFNALKVPKRGVFGSWEHTYAVRADQWIMLQAWFDHWLMGRDTGIMDAPAVEVLTNTRLHRAADEWPASDATLVEVPVQGGQYVATPVHAPLALPLPDHVWTVSEAFPEGLYVSGVPTLSFKGSLQRGGGTYYHAELYEEKADGKRLIVIMGWLHAAHADGHKTYSPFAPGETRSHEMQFLPIDHVVQPGSKLVLVLRSAGAEDGYGGPEGGLTEPGVVTISDATLRLPTLPMGTLAPAPRSAS
jgi:predicted acyl esterase